MRRTCFAFMCFVFVLALSLQSCADHTADDGEFYAGETVSASQLEAYRDALAESTAHADNGTAASAPGTVTAISAAPDGWIVYWTASGKTYHMYRDCRYIVDSQSVFSGTSRMAREAGRESLCKVCGKRYAAERG